MRGAFLLLLVLLLATTGATPVFPDAQAELVRVVDGDTILVNIRGYPDIIGKEILVRLTGVDTPEMHDKRPAVRAKAIEAREVLDRALSTASTIELRPLRRDKYFRINAEVWADGKNLSDHLLATGLALPYDGGTKARRP